MSFAQEKLCALVDSPELHCIVNYLRISEAPNSTFSLSGDSSLKRPSHRMGLELEPRVPGSVF